MTLLCNFVLPLKAFQAVDMCIR